MKLPQLTSSQFSANNRVTGGAMTNTAIQTGVAPQDCGTLKAIGCAASVAACAAVCVGSVGTACVECFAALGMGGCIDCLK